MHRPLTPEQRRALADACRDPWLRWVLPIGLVLGVLLSAVWPNGWLG